MCALMLERLYDQIFDAGVWCKDCDYNEQTMNPSSYGDGQAIEVLRECVLDSSQLYKCPGIRSYVTEIKLYGKEHGI